MVSVVLPCTAGNKNGKPGIDARRYLSLSRQHSLKPAVSMPALLLAALTLSAGVAHASLGEAEFKLYKLDPSKYPLAKCIDGTPGAFYWSPGSQSQRNSGKGLVMFLEGGGWCVGTRDCYSRSKTNLGSSAAYPPEWAPGEGGDGLMSNDPSLNPHLASFDKVYVKYCDGASCERILAVDRVRPWRRTVPSRNLSP